jgi:hypothetical protein
VKGGSQVIELREAAYLGHSPSNEGERVTMCNGRAFGVLEH